MFARLLFVFSVVLTLTCAQPNAATFNAAVVQYYPYGLITSLDASTAISYNVASFIAAANNISSSGVGASIIVFPEAALGYQTVTAASTCARSQLTQYCEAVAVNSVPCTALSANQSRQLRPLSCAAQSIGITMVINMCEQLACSAANDPSCPADGNYLYDTNVVIRNDGLILAKYHKVHLFNQICFDTPPIQTATFTPAASLLQATFTSLVGFDIEFSSPVNQLLTSATVQTVAYSTQWAENQPPMLTSVMIQQAFSRIHNVNMLAANTLASIGNGGGIFTAGRPLSVAFNPTNYNAFEGQTNISYATVPTTPVTTDNSSYTNQFVTIPSIPSPAVPCSVTAIGLNGNCTFLLPITTPQVVSVSYGAVTCVANITLSNSTQAFPSTIYYALYASAVDYLNADVENVLTLQSCFLMRCQSVSTSAGQPLQCNNNVYAADVYVSAVDISASLNCSLFASNSPSVLASGQVLPMIAVNNASLIDTTAFTFGYVGQSSAATCWWRQVLNGTLTQPLYSMGMYGVHGYVSPLPSSTNHAYAHNHLSFSLLIFMTLFCGLILLLSTL